MSWACEDARTQSRRACANTLLYFSCLKHVNEIVLGKSRQAHQRKQSFRFPSSLINHSTLLLERSSAKLLVFTIMHSTGSERVDAPSFLSLLNALQSCTGTLDRLWTRRRANLLVFTERVEAPSFLSLQSCTRTLDRLYASTRSVYAKWYWVNHGRLTSEQTCTRTLDRLWTRRRVRSTRNGTG